MRQQLKLMVAMLAILGAYLVAAHLDDDPMERGRSARALAQALECIPGDSSPAAEGDSSMRAGIARAVERHRELTGLEAELPLCEPNTPEGAGDVRRLR